MNTQPFVFGQAGGHAPIVANQQLFELFKSLYNENNSPSMITDILQKIRNGLSNENKVMIKYIMESGAYKVLLSFGVKAAMFLYSSTNHGAQPANFSPTTQTENQCVSILKVILQIFIKLICDQTLQKIEQFHQNGIVRLIEISLTITKHVSITEDTIFLIGNLVAEDYSPIKQDFMFSETFYAFCNSHFYIYWKAKPQNPQTFTWMIDNLFSRIKSYMKDPHKIQKIQSAYIPLIGKLLNAPCPQAKCHINLYKALFHLTIDFDNHQLQIHEILINRFKKENQEGKNLIMDVYGNMASISQFGVQCIIQNPQLLNYLINSLKNKQPNKKQEKFMSTCGWILSNILAGTAEQIDYLILNYSIFFNELYYIIEINDKFSILKELIWAVCNMINSCSIYAFQMLYSCQVLTATANKVSKILEHNNEPTLEQVYLQGVQCYIQKHQKYPDKFGLQIHQKNALMKALIQTKQRLTQEHLQIRAINAINYLQSALIVQTMNQMHL